MKTVIVTSRDRPWLEDLFRRHHRQVRAYAVRRVGSDDADDIVSEVFGTAWRSRETVPEDALPWLYRAAANHVLHAHRGRSRRGRLIPRLVAISVDDSMATDFAQAVGNSLDASRQVHDLLAMLPYDDAEILRLSAWEQLSPTEIATVLCISPTAARSRLQRARRRAEELLNRADSLRHQDLHESPSLIHSEGAR